MNQTNIPPVRLPVTDIPRGITRDRRLSRAVQARRRLDSSPRGGRAWINGREIGGPDPRYGHLARIHD